MTQAAVLERPATPAAVSRERVEDFLFAEAEMLDRWQISEWAGLFTHDAMYLIAPVGLDDAETLDPTNVLFLVADDHTRITQRALRLLKKSAHAEYPHSRTRHLVSNVRIREARDNGELYVSAYFATYRVRRGEVMTYMGQVFYRLVEEDGGFRIREKRVCLDLDSLRPQGTLSIVL